MSFESGGFLDDIMDDLMYPESKWEAIKYGLGLFIFYPILILAVLPLSFFISFIIGLESASPKRECDCCKKYKLNDVRSSNKFYWFCKECSKKEDKLMKKFMENKK